MFPSAVSVLDKPRNGSEDDNSVKMFLYTSPEGLI